MIGDAGMAVNIGTTNDVIGNIQAKTAFLVDFPDEFIVDEHAAEWREPMRKWAEQYGPQESL